MLAIQYVKSIPRYVTVRLLGPHWNWLYTSPFACIRLANIAPSRLPREDWVRIHPILSGICGSDLATIAAKGSTYFSPFTSCPFVLGHEVVGEIIETGDHVIDFKNGDRVVLQPPLHCAVRGILERCPPCREGRESHCENVTHGIISPGIQTGYCKDTGGGWSNNFVAHQKQLHRLPPELSNEEAVLVEPFSCCLHAVLKARLRNHHTVVTLGGGTMGALTVAAIRGIGSKCRLVVVAKYPHQQRTARNLGADVVIGTGNLYQRMARILSADLYQPELGPPVLVGGAQFCFDCIGSDRSIDDAVRFTAAAGTVILVGMPGIPKSVDWTGMWHRELSILGSYTSDSPTFSRAITLLAEMKGRLKGIVGAKFPLTHYKDALLCAFDTGRSGVTKTVFESS